ncbi:hypothetical protein Tco_0646925 [Tanacetum coccineum]
MFIQKNVDYVALLWEDFMFQADNREISSARKEHMPYPRFTKVIINHLISKDKTISMRNRINIHIVRNDTLLGTLKFVSKTQDYQQYGALIPEEMINQEIKDSKAYKTYLAFATKQATPKKARKFKKIASPLKKLSHVLEEEPAKKPKRAKKPTKKSTTVPIAGVVIRDTPGMSMSKKKALAKVDRGKGIDLLSDIALLEVAQIKKTLKKRKLETHKLHASGSGDGFGSQPKVLDEQQDKTTGTNEGTVTKPGLQIDADGDNEASDSEKTDSDEDENPNLNQNDDEEEYEEEYVRTPKNNEFSDDDEEYDELYKDVNLRLKDVEHEEEGKRDAEMTDAGHDDVSQEKSYEQVKDDAYVTLTATHVTQKKTEVDNEVVSMMNVMVRQEEPSTQTPSLPTIPAMIIPETSIVSATTTPSTILPITPLPQQSTPTPTPALTTEATITSIPALPDFSSLFDAQLSTRLEDSISKAFRSYTAEVKKKAQGEKKKYIDLIKKSMKNIVKDEVKSQLPHILPKEVSDYATPVIQSTITESLENVVLAKSSSQTKSTYEATTSLTEFDLKKILLDKMHKIYSLKRDREDKDKDEDTPAGSDQGDLGNTDDQPNVEAASKSDWFKKPERPPTPDPDWNAIISIDFRPPQTWINKIAKAEKPPLTFDELMNTPIDFSAYGINNLKIDNLTQ